MADKGVYHNFRLSMRNPVHVKINNVLSDLNTNMFKSKNQFIADALEYYINLLESDELTNRALKENERKRKYVTVGDIENMKTSITAEVTAEVQKEMLNIMAGITGNIVAQASSGIVNSAVEEKENMIDSDLMNLAGMWGD